MNANSKNDNNDNLYVDQSVIDSTLNMLVNCLSSTIRDTVVGRNFIRMSTLMIRLLKASSNSRCFDFQFSKPSDLGVSTFCKANDMSKSCYSLL